MKAFGRTAMMGPYENARANRVGRTRNHGRAASWILPLIFIVFLPHRWRGVAGEYFTRIEHVRPASYSSLLLACLAHAWRLLGVFGANGAFRIPHAREDQTKVRFLVCD